MTNLSRCTVCNRVFRMSERHVCFDVAPAPASPWDPGLKRENKKRGTRNRPHRPTVFLAPPPRALSPQQGKDRRRCIYCKKIGADVEVKTELVSGRSVVVVFKHGRCGPKRERSLRDRRDPSAIVIPTSVACVECGAELLDGSHAEGCPYGTGPGSIRARLEGSDA